ncbi:alanine racemase [Humisphaera borealis]|uniref:Alanine racemase n=1 Tax=Humisphaera borealis TaxID=2807512 RepID=A0A7M2X152_9BACT|nr:alanine racemase [Humisphaera borealis]QOV90841.1 alanine racemase [Humisphaera borealis]
MDATPTIDIRHTLGEPRVLISRRSLLHNAGVIRRALSPGVRLCAMLKADAYGHGALIAADTLCNFCNDGSGKPPADTIAVASIDEAMALPDLRVPVLVFRPLENAFIGRQRLKIEEAIRHGWVLTVCSLSGVEDIARIALQVGRRANVQVMVDTGMVRSGVDVAALPGMLQHIEARPSIKLWGICTHFASAENPESAFTLEQSRRFHLATDPVGAAYGGRLTRHAANSGALFFHRTTHADMVRPGLALYGIDPSGRPTMDRPLKPVLKWLAPIVGIQEVSAGSTVGYGQTWCARRPTRVGLLPIGYADGYPRSFSNGAKVLLHGRAAAVIGRVSMDMTTVDLTDHPDAHVGEEVTLLDDNPLSPVSVYELARWSNTIPYEILSRIGARIKRVPTDPEDAPFEESEAETSDQDFT